MNYNSYNYHGYNYQHANQQQLQQRNSYTRRYQNPSATKPTIATDNTTVLANRTTRTKRLLLTIDRPTTKHS